MAASEADIAALMRQQLELAVQERDTLQAHLESVRTKLDAKIKFAPKRSNMTAEEITDRIAKLQFSQSTVSLSAHEERELLREIKELQGTRSSLASVAAYQKDLDALKAQRSELSTALNATRDRIRVLREGIKKMDVLIRLRAANPRVEVDAKDLTIVDVEVPTEAIGRLIGRKGQGLRDIEEAALVSIDVEDAKRGEKEAAAAAAAAAPSPFLRITGLPSGIAKARELVTHIVTMKEERVPVSATLISMLTSSSGQKLRELETSLDIRVTLEREAGVAVVRGHTAGLASFRSSLAEVERLKVAIPVDTRTLPSLIGKGGVNLKRVREESGAEVDIQREGEGPATVFVLSIGPGAAATIAKGAAIIRSLVQEHTEFEEVVPIPRDAIPFLVSKQGERIQAFQKETGVFARVSKLEEGSKEPPTVTLRGKREALDNARRGFKLLMAEFERVHKSLRVTASQARMLVGPGGAGIRKLRADTGVNIEVDEAGAERRGKEKEKEGEAKERRRVNRADELGLPAGSAIVTVRGDTPEAVQAALATVHTLVSSFREVRVPVGGNVISALIRNKGELIRAIEAETGAQLDVQRESAEGGAGSGAAFSGDQAVIISGTEAAVFAAQAKVSEAISSHLSKTLTIPDPSMRADLMGKGGAVIRSLQDETKTEINVDKAGTTLTIVGSAAAITEAEARVRAMFDKFTKENVVMHVDTSLLPSLIGKGGATVHAIQEQTGAQLHVEKTGEVRIHGPEEAIAAARARIVELCHLDKPLETMHVDPTIVGRLIGRGGANLRKLEEAHSVSIAVDTNGGNISVRGEAAGLAAAKVALRKAIKDASRLEREVQVPSDKLGGIIGSKGARLRQLEADTHAHIDVPRERSEATVTVKIRGSAVALDKAACVLSALAAGSSVRTLSRSQQHLAELLGRDRRGLERLEAGARLHGFGPEPEDPEEGASAAPAHALVVAVGDDAGVARTVAAVDRVLASRFADSYAVLPVPQGFLSGAGADKVKEEGDSSAASADEIIARLSALQTEHGVSAAAEREAGYIALWGAPAGLAAAKASVASLIASFNARHGSVACEQWMLPVIIGKKGAGIQQLEADFGCKIQVEKDGKDGKPCLLLSATTPAALEAAVAKADAYVTGMAKRRVVFQVQPQAVGVLIGKGGATVRAIQEETGASLDLDRDLGSVIVRGATEEAVEAGKERVMDLLSEAGFTAKQVTDAELAALVKKVTGLSVSDVTALTARGAAVLKGIQDDTGAAITVDREAGTAVIRGRSAADLQAAQSALQQALADARAAAAEEEYSKAAAAAAPVAPRQEAPAASRRLPIGAPEPTPEELAAELARKQRKAAKKKAAKLRKAGGAPGAADEDSEDESVVTEPAAPVVAAKAAAPVAAAPARAPAPAPAPAAARVAAPAPAPAPAAAPVRAAAPAHAAAPSTPTKGAAAPTAAAPTPGRSTEDLLAGLLGADYKRLFGASTLASVTQPVAAPAPVPVAVHAPAHAAPAALPSFARAAAPAPAPVPVAAPAARPAAHQPGIAARMPPPGLERVQPVAAPAAVRATAPVPAAAAPSPSKAAGPVWGAARKPATAAEGGAVADFPSLPASPAKPVRR